MAELKPLYLVFGDDEARIDSWRRRVRERAEAEGGPGALELLEGSVQRPADVAVALATLSFAVSGRYLLVDHAEAWKAGELDALGSALAEIPAETVLVLIARGKPLARLKEVVEAAGGELRECAAPRPQQLPRWVVERAAAEGLRLDVGAARALIASVGTGPSRLAREIEKLAILAHPKATLTAEDVARLASHEVTTQVYELADAVVAQDASAALALAEELAASEDRPGRLAFPLVRRLRDVHRAAELIESGATESQIARALSQPSWLAGRTIAKARRTERDALERALCAFADFEVETRGGALDERTAFSLALAEAARG